MDLSPTCYLLALPAELRIEIYKHLFPTDKLILVNRVDEASWAAEEIYDEASRGVTLTMMLTCRKIHLEVTEIVLGSNRVVVTQPLDDNLFLDKLGATSRRFISDLAVYLTYGIGDLGRAWKAMDECPRLKKLFLFCPPDGLTWRKVLAQLTLKAIECYETPPKTGVEPKFLCIYARIVTIGDSNSASPFLLRLDDEASHIASFEECRRCAAAHSQVFSFSMPKDVENIIVLGGDTDRAFGAFKSYNESKKKLNSWYFTHNEKDCERTYRLTRNDNTASASQALQVTLEAEGSSHTST